jgi:membrane protein implicated in regulation of membrane protease activity
MHSIFLGAFVAGLVLNVFFMIRGVERWRRSDVAARLDAFGRELTFGRVSLRIPVVASFASAFGLSGYLLLRYTSLATLLTVVIAIVVAAAAVTGAVMLIAKWAVPAAKRDLPDERYLLQGQLARVTRSIPFDGEGEIRYEIDGTVFVARAQTLDGTPVHGSLDVVIDRVENGIAFVEEWSQVEQRL